MTKPNMALRNLPRHPFRYDKWFEVHEDAEKRAEELKAEGKDVRITSFNRGTRFKRRRAWRVLYREKKA